MTEQHIELIGLIVAALGGREAIAQALKWWAGYKERRAAAREELEGQKVEIELAEAESESVAIGALKSQIDMLAARVSKLERENADLRKALDASQSAHKRDQDECSRRVSSLERRLGNRRDNTASHRTGGAKPVLVRSDRKDLEPDDK